MTSRRRFRTILLAMLVAANAALLGTLLRESPTPSFSSVPRTETTPAEAPTETPTETPAPDAPSAPPSIANLDPDLRDALRQAMEAAAADGVELVVNSGWRSPEHQQRLLDEAVVKYGSAAEAARWVATPDTSPHVSGDAVDIGPTAGAAWVAAHGAAYGLCQIYANEPWHFELRTGGCPPLYADPTHDPRMQR